MISRGKAPNDGSRTEFKALYKDPVIMKDIRYRIVNHVCDGKTRYTQSNPRAMRGDETAG